MTGPPNVFTSELFVRVPVEPLVAESEIEP